MSIAIIVLGCGLVFSGLIGFILSLFLFGDIGIAAGIGSLSGLFAGVGFVLTGIKLKILERK